MVSFEVISSHIREKIKELFETFDDDQDGLISSNKIDLSYVSADILEII